METRDGQKLAAYVHARNKAKCLIDFTISTWNLQMYCYNCQD